MFKTWFKTQKPFSDVEIHQLKEAGFSISEDNLVASLPTPAISDEGISDYEHVELHKDITKYDGFFVSSEISEAMLSSALTGSLTGMEMYASTSEESFDELAEAISYLSAN